MPDPSDLLAALDPEQRQVAQTIRGPLVVVAGAGTGKTRAITHRIAYGVATNVYQPTEVLAVSFTTRAAGEMRSRLQQLGAGGVQARTFHSAALRQARFFWPQVYGGELPEVTGSKIPLVVEATRKVGLRPDQSVLRDLASAIEWAKVSNVRPAQYAVKAKDARREVGDLQPSQVGEVYAAYEEVKRGHHRIDMEDILLVTAAMLTEDERVAAQVRSQYRWFVVDEFQDVNPLQATLLDLWLGGRDELCVVGDPRQTIYSFAGAKAEYLTGFTRRYEDAQRVDLVRNYRSTPQVVAAANAVFDRRTFGVTLEAQRSAGDPVTYRGFGDEPAEAAYVAGEVRRLHDRGLPYRDMAVLFRINAQSEAYEEALGAQGIPYVLRGVERFFERGEVRQAVTLLRAAAVSETEASGDLAGQVRDVLSGLGYTADPPAASGAVRDRWESLHALVSMATDLGDNASLADLVNDLERRAATANAPTADGVTLATMHSAKGLEWEAVFCVGMQEGTVPLVHATTEAEIEEERRLFYVGITRARSFLTISWAAARQAGGRGNRQPTRFLDRLLPADHAARSQGRPQAKAKKVRLVARPDDFDEALFERLRAWRTEQAQEQSVPAYVIFNDQTLEQLTILKPSDVRELVQVKGIGQTKLEQYGEDVLRVIASE
ncbi:ATP-dependent DNA helicase UvrD2 [Aeromicrobium massiliense]|uniref:ATP-dependent DNA helicase UvrD2 n=1 Tax=Aeromicrobium massiliense TaxID=1464554 RepID=UPI0002EB5418|nr:ATP-dependent DNA helicase UvrD2 [Aeromicrobium massiliense]